jgi:hypothetical protein
MSAAFAIASRWWREGVIAVLVVIVAVLLLMVEARTAERDSARTGRAAEQQAHQQTVANYRAATAAAQQQAAATVERVKADQTAINERNRNDYEARLADVDARYDRVRVQLAARSDLRSSDPAPVSIASEATCRAYAGADCNGLLAKLRIAERQAWNLVALRQWVTEQGAVVFSPAAPANGREGG